MSYSNSPNMNLPIPNVGTQPGPDYATNVNSSLSLIDQHDHTPGYGVQITPDGLNINAELSFNGNSAANLSLISFSPQTSNTTLDSIYVKGVDLYYVDGDGNDVRITQSGGVAGSPGSITNLTAPASATYVAGTSTFVWQSNTNIAANMDFGAAVMRNLSPNSTFALTLQPPAGLASNYSITLPSLPASQKIMTLDASGIMSAPYVVDNSTIEISSNTIQVKNLGITAAKIANNTITTTQISNSAAITQTQLAYAALATTSQTINSSTDVAVPTGVNFMVAKAIAGGGGGGGGSQGGGGGGGGAGQYIDGALLPLTGVSSIHVIVGAGGTGGAGAQAGQNDGTSGSDTIISTAVATVTGNRTSGSAIITNVSSTAGLAVNQLIEGTGIQSYTYIKSIDSATQITLSKTATSGSSTVTTLSPYNVLVLLKGGGYGGAGQGAAGGRNGGNSMFQAGTGGTFASPTGSGGGGGGAGQGQGANGSIGATGFVQPGGGGGGGANVSISGTAGGPSPFVSVPAASVGNNSGGSGGSGFGIGGLGGTGSTGAGVGGSGGSAAANSGAGGGGGGGGFISPNATGGTGGSGGSGQVILYWQAGGS